MGGCFDSFLKSDVYSNDYSKYWLKTAHEKHQSSNTHQSKLLLEELTYLIIRAASFRNIGFPQEFLFTGLIKPNIAYLALSDKIPLHHTRWSSRQIQSPILSNSELHSQVEDEGMLLKQEVISHTEPQMPFCRALLLTITCDLHKRVHVPHWFTVLDIWIFLK